MNHADLGPPIPESAIDLPPMHITSWSLIDAVNTEGDAVVTIHGRRADRGPEAADMIWLLTVSTTTGTPVAAALLSVRGRAMIQHHLHPQLVPGNARDLARTLVVERFGAQAAG